MSIELSLATPIVSGLIAAIGVLWNEYKAEKKQTALLHADIKKEKQEKLDQYKAVYKEVTDLCKAILQREDKAALVVKRLEEQLEKLDKHIEN